MIKVSIGDIFDSKADVLVNTVNCVGVMGKGIALDFKKKYPLMFGDYAMKCKKGEIKPGHIYPYYVNGQLKVINFATKEHWRNVSKISYVESCMNEFSKIYKDLGINSIAFPPLGCGNGKLNWEIVGPIMYKSLSKLDIDYIEIFAPHGTNKKYITEEFLSSTSEKDVEYSITPKYTNNWYLVLHMINLLKHSEYNVVVGRTIFQKIFYLLDYFGINMNIKFYKGSFGPYSPEINEIVSFFSRNNLVIEKNYNKIITIVPTENYVFDKNKYSEDIMNKFNCVYELFKTFRNTYYAEMVSTIIFSYEQLKNSNNYSEKELINYICDWKNKYCNENGLKDIKQIYNYLTIYKIINI